MICPECKKNQTSIINSKHDKATNTVKRGRYCTCGYAFVTYEINKSELKYKTSKILKSSKNIIKTKRKEEIIIAGLYYYNFYKRGVLLPSALN